MTLLPRTLRQAARRLRRTPAFSIAAMLTLTLGIGATTAVFSVVDGILLRPLPYDHPERLMDLTHTLAVSGISTADQSDASYLYYRRTNHVFTDVAAYRADAVNLGAVDGPAAQAEAERTAAGRVSASLFSVLRVGPLRGRALTDSDDRPGAAPVVVIGERLWQRKYGGDPSIIGRTVPVDGVQREVVGIMPARFHFPEPTTALWLPLALDPGHTESATFDYKAVARLRDGVTREEAAADLARLLPHLPDVFPGRLTASAIEATHMRPVVRPLRDAVVGDVGRVLWVVLGAVAFVLLIACANVANLFLVRAEGRQRELEVRRALGASRGRIATEFLAEGFVLAALGGAIGLVLASTGIDALRTLGGAIDLPRLADVSVDGTVFAFAAAVTVLAALLVGGLPALRRDGAPAAILTDTGRATGGRARHRARNALVVSQVALALVLLAGSGLMLRSFAHLRALRPGFEPSQALTFQVALPDATYPAPGDGARFFERAVDAISALPGVQAVGVVSKLPLDDEGKVESGVFVEDHLPAEGQLPAVHEVSYVSSGYFRALRIPLLEGRLFQRPDPERPLHEVIVSRAFADRYWKGESALGKRVLSNATREFYTVVGVVGSVRGATLEEPPQAMLYYPLVTANPIVTGDTAAPWTPRHMAFVVRSSAPPSTMVGPTERAVHALDPGLPLYRVRPMTQILTDASARTSLTLLLLAIASAVALALGAVGIYGVISYVVSMRTREIGVRLALGAQPGAVSRMVSRQGLSVAAVGVGVGLAGAFALTRFLAALLYDVSPTDPATLAGAAALLLGVALLASWLPARRAARVDPALALRAE